jgi:hypothetical protein
VKSSIQFEAFELSTLNSAVITTKGRLQRLFPGPAFSVDLNTFQQVTFLNTVAHTLAKMSHQIVLGTMPKVLKAGRMYDEDRDTTHPKMVTELFMGFLRAVGNPASVSRIWKNTRDEVMFQNSKYLPCPSFSPLRSLASRAWDIQKASFLESQESNRSSKRLPSNADHNTSQVTGHGEDLPFGYLCASLCNSIFLVRRSIQDQTQTDIKHLC